jgi:prepilin-type N-terminal cleavage/methylation domain-containing protein
MKKRLEQKNKGFTLVETLVAIGVLVVAVTGTLTAVQSGLRDSTIAKDEVVAFWLAQEGMEYIKNIRDQNILFSLNEVSNGRDARHWLFGISELPTDKCWFGGSGTAQKTCSIDSTVGGVTGITNCSGGAGTCEFVRQDSATGRYGYNSSWPATYFKREIQLIPIAGVTDEIIISETISWTNRGTPHTFTVTESFFNR